MLLDFLFPPTCVGCNKTGEYLCQTCRKKLVPHPSICLYCHKPTTDFQTCQACKLTNEHAVLDGCQICFSYTPLIKKLIYKLKFYHRFHVATFLAQQLALCCQANETLRKSMQSDENGSKKQCTITYVPSHRRRRYIIKGYNQSEILAKYLAHKLMLPFEKIGKKTRHTASQVTLTREQRQKNLLDAFAIAEHYKNHAQNEEVLQKTILIVDDITTTGSTLTELAKTIKKAFPTARVWGVVLARNTT